MSRSCESCVESDQGVCLVRLLRMLPRLTMIGLQAENRESKYIEAPRLLGLVCQPSLSLRTWGNVLGVLEKLASAGRSAHIGYKIGFVIASRQDSQV